MNPSHDQPTSKPALVANIREVREHIAKARANRRTIALVPTMGALHAGHLSLIEAAKARDAFTVVSIFVNPTQFGPNEDLAAYPNTLEVDIEACRRVGADLVFAPTAAEMYPPNDQTRIHPGPLADTMCGLSRPGHFVGVCTVVAKLFEIVRPDFAVFGQKDAQQALIIRRMVADLFIPVEIVVAPIVREPDGLAMSSRNAYLSAKEREQAICLNRALQAGAASVSSGVTDASVICTAMRAEIVQSLGEANADDQIDYLVAVDADSLQSFSSKSTKLLLAGAVQFGKARLIDNLLVDLPARQG